MWALVSGTGFIQLQLSRIQGGGRTLLKIKTHTSVYLVIILPDSDWIPSPKNQKKKTKNSWTQSVIPPGELGAWQLVSLSRSWPLPHLCSGAVRWAHFLMSRVSRRKKKTKKHGGLPPAKLKLKSQRIKTICLCVCVCVCAYSRQTHGWLWNDMAKAFLVAKRPPEKNSCVT